MPVYVNDSDSAVEVNELFVNVGDESKSVLSGWVNVNGEAKLFYELLTPPTNIRETADSHNHIRWSWNAVARATSYEYQWRSGTSGAWSSVIEVTGTSVTRTGLSSESTYQIRMRSKRGSRVGEWSSPVRGTTDRIPYPPNPPRNLTECIRSVSSIYICFDHSITDSTHDAPGGPRRYRLSTRAENEEYDDVWRIGGTRSYQLYPLRARFRNMPAGIDYTFSIQARNAGGYSSNNPEIYVAAVSGSGPAPSVPTGLERFANYLNPNYISVRWDHVSGVRWTLRRKLSSASKWGQPTSTTGTTAYYFGPASSGPVDIQLRAENNGMASAWTSTLTASGAL